MTNDALIKEARDEAARVDRNESTMEGELLTLLADALTAANAREAQANAERDAALKRMDIAERERDTAVARLHAAEDLVVKNAIERDAYKQSADGAGVVICRIKAERDAARAQLAEVQAERDKWQRIRTPTHGPCCTCQACGLDHDACRCDLDDVADDLAQARTQLAEVQREAGDAVAAAHYEGFLDGRQGAGNYSHYDTSKAAKAAERLRGESK